MSENEMKYFFGILLLLNKIKMFSIEFLRQFRIGEYTIFDTAVAFLGMLVVFPLVKIIFRRFKISIPLLSWLSLTIPVGIFTHLIIGKITPMTKNFIDLGGHYILKLVILAMLVYGVMGFKKVKDVEAKKEI